MLQSDSLRDFDQARRLEFTVPGRYRELLEHIELHHHALSQQHKREIPLTEAVTSWYDHVYLPIISAIRQSGILAQFPKWTEADLYIWIWRWQRELSEHYGRAISPGAAVDDFAKQKKRKRGR